jgi:2-desacetyl-2-hydroxyethyl bacteriochlorophyllide A dehydrogenase
MKAILFPGSGAIEHITLPKPQPGPGEVLIEMRMSGICGTDLFYMNETPQQRADRARVIPGHETCGVIVELGAGVTMRQVGERVVGFHHVGCGHCHYCRIDVPTQCPDKVVTGRTLHGSDAQYIVLPQHGAFPLPDDFSFEDGALLSCNVSTAFSGLMKAEVDSFQRVAVFGQGGVGLSAVMLANALGARVAAVDLSDNRLALSRELGAELTLNPARDDVPDQLRRFGGGRGVHTVIECSGSSKAVEQALASLGPLGKLVIIGAGDSHIATHVGVLIASEIQVLGSSVYRPGEYEPMVNLVRNKQLPLHRLIGGRFPIDEAEEAFKIAARQDIGKLLFAWNGAVV